jgi:PBP1b-binding outer membrane lipoprotein LpoB
VGSVKNRSTEHIDTNTFIKDIERECIKSGKVKFVATDYQRGELRSEKEDQQSFSTEETAKALAAETGADYMLMGYISTQVDAVEGKRVTLYKVDMELIDIESFEKVWIETKEIKKYVEQSKVKW